MRRRGFLAVLLSAAGLAIFTPAAGATFHLMKVSEVNASGGADYIELQMFLPGQNLVHNHTLFVYNGDGQLVHQFPMSADLPNGANQAHILIGNANVASTFGVTPDFTDTDLEIGTYASGGAACFADAEPPDCVAWGVFNPQLGFPDAASATSEVAPSGLPLAGASAGRLITRGCPTLLESPIDDAGSSATDFALGPPTPQNNAMTPTEKPCGGSGPGPSAKKKCKKVRRKAAAAKKKRKKCKRKRRGKGGGK